MYKSAVVVYEGENLLGDVDVYFNPHIMDLNLREKLKEKIRISHFSTPSERCTPLAVLHTITSPTSGVCFRMECSNANNSNSPLNLLHSSSLRENKTAIMSLGREELHLVAMRSRRNSLNPCFWGFIITPGLYESCLVMLNLRCLGIVFDLDETLIVANTLRSFEDRIEALQRKVTCEIDTQRVNGMLAEIKRYQEDRNILKQYAESDQVVDNGKIIKSQSEVVPALSDNYQPLVRPIIRLQEKNIILTRINPQIRDTSVLVRLRPAWEDLRSYLTARGRKRFEVYVCTMAERDYALEMWRLLDPDLNLINIKELLNRIVCVKAGLKKSLFNVFQDGSCHPKMALVIDDRLKVWDEKDQPRVHVVPAFAPYYAPQAEANNATPILCVARNVACNVRGGFFKDFDDGLLQRIAEIAYEDEIKEILSPDVSNYLVSEDDASALNGNKEPLGFDGMADVEVERRLKDSIMSSTSPPVIPRLDPRLDITSQYPHKQLQPATPLRKPLLTQINLQEASLHNSPAREEGEVPESELDPDTRRRLLILQHGMDMRDHLSNEPQFPIMPPMQVSPAKVPPRGGWFQAEEEMNPLLKQHPLHAPQFVHNVETPNLSDRVLIESQRLPKEVLQRDDRLRLNHVPPSYASFPGDEGPLGQSSSSNRDMDIEAGRSETYAESPSEYLHDIAIKCGTKVEFKPALVPSIELQFFVEVLFAGEKIGEGIGRTRREAQHQAAEGSLMTLADKYLSRLKSNASEKNGFLSDANLFRHQSLLREEFSPFSTLSEPTRVLDSKMDGPKKGSIAALKELCMMEGLGMTFQPQPQLSGNVGHNNEIYAQVEIDGEVWGKGIGLTWNEAKMQAAERAFVSLNSWAGQYPLKRQASPRSFQGMPSKRFRPEFPKLRQHIPSPARYSKSASFVP